jgi:hypothetical protein
MNAAWLEGLSPRHMIFLGAALAALLIAPWLVNDYLLTVLIVILYFAYTGQAWNIMMGFAGQLSLGHAIYAGIGGYVAAILFTRYGVGPWLGFLVAIPVCAACGAVIGFLAFRFGVSGVYFAILTIAFAEFARIGFDHLDFVNASAGLFLPVKQYAHNDLWRLRALESIDFAAASALPAWLAGRVRLRLAEAQAWKAFDEARQGHDAAASRAESAAVRELALCDRGTLAPEDLDLYEESAVRVAASRWAAETPPKETGKRGVALTFTPRAPGETCVRAVEQTGARTGAAPRTLAERCTFGVVWRSALRWAPSGSAATLAVQPLPAWTELWTLRRGEDGGWSFDTLTAATTEPEVGYVESAGFSPDGNHLLVVREARVGGHVTRRFQVLASAGLSVEKWAGSADRLLAFKRWSSPAWRAATLALR